MADDDKTESESAETPESTPAGKSDAKSDPDPIPPHRDKRPWMERATWILGSLYYGGHVAFWTWQELEQLIPLVRRYM